ncbi:MAG: N-acetyl-gamma-glutamyl-phosphate reductase [Thermodesulfobacteriota bacterium]|nr:N-acetyl-gamma-glutamyl-phosphate reductase [Thermodesulfobacteriota bacterium]
MKKDKIKVGLIGATGYGGVGLIELLIGHPHVSLRALMAKQDINKPISTIYPHLKGFCDLPVYDPTDPECPDDFDIVFYATPDGVGQKDARKWLDKGIKIIDYSGDFRFNNEANYASYAFRIGKAGEHADPELLSSTIYGMPELHREEIADKKLVGNPGCFAASCILGIAPAVKFNLIDSSDIIFDAKTGVSGAGKKPSPTFHFPARYEAMNAYKISGHQHIYEIEKELSSLSGKEINITFTPHVVPLSRGILSTIYADLLPDVTMKILRDAYYKMYSNEPFIRVFSHGETLTTTDVRGSNYCNILLNIDSRTGKAIVVSLIDNLVKGQAGNALQNMNIMMEIDETAGLMHPGNFP